MEYGPVRFELCIDGLEERDKDFATKIFLGVWNSMARLFKSCELTEAYQNVFDTYYPTENSADSNMDNAYVSLYEKMTKEICDKLSPSLGVLPSGKTIYVSENEPITFDPKIGKGWLTGYVK